MFEAKELVVKFDIPEQKKLVHEVVIPIRWGDMDAMGHVNNTTYFRYLETCRIDWMHAAGGATTIWVDFPKQKAIALPDRIRALVS